MDDRAIELGRAALLRGDAELPVPDDADLGVLRSVVVHCTVYDVTFGTALLSVPHMRPEP